MQYKFEFSNEEERNEIIANNSERFLIEEHHLFEGNFLVFTDEKSTLIEMQELKEKIDNNNLITLDIQLSLYEEILSLREELSELKSNA